MTSAFVFLDIGEEDYLNIGDMGLLVIVLGGVALTLQGRKLTLTLQFDRGIDLTLQDRPLALTIPERP